MKKWFTGIAAGATLCSLGATAALLMGLLSLPGFQVGIGWQWFGAGGTNSTALVTLSGVGAGFDVMDGDYDGWCIEDNFKAPGPLAFLYDTTDAVSNLPADLQGIAWDQVNYILNNRGAATVADVQIALWMLTYGTVNGLGGVVTAGAQALLDDAALNGVGFVPGPGEIVGVVCYFDGIQPDPNDSDQEALIQVTVPPMGEGCTPGFWKNDGGKFGFNNWAPTGYSPDDDFNTVFGVTYLPAGTTLLEALDPTTAHNAGFGKEIWHGVAALLNASHPGVDYMWTVAEVIAFVQAGDGNPLAYANELTDCPLSRIKSNDGFR